MPLCVCVRVCVCVCLCVFRKTTTTTTIIKDGWIDNPLTGEIQFKERFVYAKKPITNWFNISLTITVYSETNLYNECLVLCF